MVVQAVANATQHTLGRYVIVKHLAQGGMADVLLARANGIEGFERYVVIKRIRADVARDARYVAMFLDEARLAASLHHHNILGANDIGQEDGEYFFAMDYLHGEDARRLLMAVSGKEERIPIEHIITIATAAAAGLHYAHEQRGVDRRPLGIVHRDVSPANIMIGYDGSVKVADFGIAKAEQRSTETNSGTLKGKVAYMSPEQCVGEHVDRRSDVFSLGIVLYELVTTRRLFKGDNDFLTMSSIVLGYIPPPSTYRPDLPPALEAIIQKALASKRDDRYATTDELRIALEEFANAAGISRSSTGLADYLKAQFGHRPEPWLAEEDEPDVEMTIDFDGSASGVVQPPVEAIKRFPTGSEDAPILRARTKAITASPAPPADLTTVLPVAAVAPAHLPAVPEPIIPAHRVNRWWIAAATSAVVAIGVALLISSSGKPKHVEHAAQTPVQVMPVKAVAPAPVAPPVVEVATETLAVEPAPEPVSPKAKKRARATKPAPSATKRWDPSALFPE